ncbi:MAG: NAD(P)-dependent oxidoreductase [Calditrichaceae bacterium]|nr:NAD(P)-dependent oxidoreductase [Calditrichia bacterium]NUQ40606.1 NAD(P)-dependent oxidoreductase [Calditrichaceae bacterium]
MKQKILVTGAGGFIGYQLNNFLVKAGHQVIGIDIQFPPGAAHSSFEMHTLDFRQSQQMRAVMENVDIVFHLASAHLKTNLNKSEYWSVNVHSLAPLMEIAHAAGVKRFIHTSSVGVYGNLTSWPANEQSPCRPQSIYGETKLAGEQQVREFGDRKGLPYVILRPAWVFGPTCPRTRKLYRALKKGKFVMIGKGDNLRHPLYITDLLSAFQLAMTHSNAPGHLYIVAGDEAITSRELISTFCQVCDLKFPAIHVSYTTGKVLAVSVETIFRLLDKEPPVSRRTLEFFDTNNAFDISRIREELGFQPQFTLSQGIADFCDKLSELS